MTIKDKIELVSKSQDKPFEKLPGLTFDHKEIVNRIYFYRDDKFVECGNPDAIFWNVVKPYIMHFAKNIDGDVKDFRGVGRGEANAYQAWILDLRFQKWSEEYNLGIKLDDLTQQVSEFGSFVWKLVKSDDGYDIQECDLRNLRFNPKARTIRDQDIVELHYMNESQLLEKSDAWDNVDKVLEMNKEKLSKGEELEVKEYTGYVQEGKTREYRQIICTGSGESYVELFNERILPEDNPYYDFHLTKYEGSWLRKGAYQTNFIQQERANTLINENAEITEISSLLLLRSADSNTQGNVLKGVRNGQIINSADLQQIAIDNRAAGVLLGELDRIEAQVRKNLLLPDIATGEQSQGSVTFRGQALMSNAYKSAFKQMRNRILTPVARIIEEKILPMNIKDWNKEEIIELAGDEKDIELYDDAVKLIRKIQFVEGRNASGEPVTQEELTALDQDTEQEISKVGRKIGLPKNFFNFEYGITIDPVGETYDKAQQNDALIQAITLTAQNPAIADVPAFKQLLENNGIRSTMVRPEVKQAIAQANQGPQLPQMPQSLNSMVDTNV